jgi:hypothetical protein
MATTAGSSKEAGFFQKLMLVAQGLLILLAYFATVSGFADLMEINLTGKLSVERVVQVVFVFAVATAVVMAMLIGLHTMLDRDRRFTGRMTGAVAYLFFLFWSIAFGFGFFWKTFAAEDFTRGRFNADAATIQNQVDRVIGELRSVEEMATQAAGEALRQSEEESRAGGGGTCENNAGSDGARGPLTIAREKFAEDAGSTAQRIGTSWIAPLTAEAGEIAWRVRALDPGSNAALIASDPKREGEPAAKDKPELDRIRAQVAEGPEGRKAAYDTVSLRANKFVGEALRLQSSVGEPAKREFERLALDMSEAQGKLSTRWCEDPKLAALMTQAADAIAGLSQPEPISPEIIEGSAAARFATINLARNAIAGVTSGLKIELPDTIGAKTLEPLGENDIIALYATAAIDFALLFVTILSRPPNEDRSMFQKMRRIGRKRETNADDTDDMPFNAKLSGRSLEKLNAVHEAQLKVRQLSRRHAEDFVNEDSGDIVVGNRQQIVLQQRGASVREQLTRVLGSERLASEVALRASETLQRIGKRMYFAITKGEDSDTSLIRRRFANYLNINRNLFKVRPLERGSRRDDAIWAEIAARLAIPPAHLIDVFEIDSTFGNSLLLLPYAPSKVADIPKTPDDPEPFMGGQHDDIPRRGEFDETEIFVDAPPPEYHKAEPVRAVFAGPAEDLSGQTDPQPPQRRRPDDAATYAEDKAATGDVPKDGLGSWFSSQATKAKQWFRKPEKDSASLNGSNRSDEGK